MTDVLQVVVFALIAFTIGLVSWITWRYQCAWREHKRTGKEWKRLLPRHVAMVSGMTVILMTQVAVAGLFPLLNVVVFTLVLFALRDMLIYLRKRGPSELD